MLKTNKTIKKISFIAILAIFAIPTMSFADNSYGFDNGGFSLGGWGSQGGGASSYGYTPTYSNYYTAPSYSGSSYYPTYSAPSYGSYYGGYSLPSYTSSYVGNGSSVPASNKNTNTNTSSSNSTSSSSATAINNNVNNVYVYATPTGNAVVYNPQHQYLNVYCVITPSNPRLGQTVTATAYATGGTGNYTYTWGGDIYTASGPTTTFTSYTTGSKNITVTARSGEEVITKSCNVVFENGNNNNNELSAVCYANPTNASVNQLVTWTVSPNGGTGSYSYSWSGTDGLSGYSQYVGKQYTYTGLKNAYVTVTANGRSITVGCSTNVNSVAGTTYTGSSVNLTPNITSGTPVSGVFLSELPATGLSLTFVHYMIALMTIILASVFTFIYQARKRLITENI